MPGPDGDRGFGGHCFPKDLAAMIHFARGFFKEPGLLSAVWDENEKHRTDWDWEKMKGRAVSDD